MTRRCHSQFPLFPHLSLKLSLKPSLKLSQYMQRLQSHHLHSRRRSLLLSLPQQWQRCLLHQ